MSRKVAGPRVTRRFHKYDMCSGRDYEAYFTEFCYDNNYVTGSCGFRGAVRSACRIDYRVREGHIRYTVVVGTTLTSRRRWD